MIPRLLIAGNLFVDDLIFAEGTTRMGEAGGAVLHAALAASLWSDGVACMSRRGTDYPEAVLRALASRGVDLAGVRPLGCPGGRTWLLYEEAQRRMVPRLGRPTHEQVSPTPADLPVGWAQAQAVHVAPMPRPCQQALVEALPAGVLVSLDPHLPLTPATLAGWMPVLQRVDILFAGEDELSLEGQSIEAALRPLSGGRLRYVACKRGAAGGLLCDLREGRSTAWAARAVGVVDPTGCGDAFAAGFLTGLLDGISVPAALLRGVTAASFAIADWGAGGLLGATPTRAAARYQDWADDLDRA